MKNKLFLAGVVFAVIFISGCITPKEITSPSTTLDYSAIDADEDFENYLTNYKQRRLFETSAIPDRSAYDISGRVFENLPPFPEDFLYKVYLIKTGKFFDLNGLGPEYWKQPEFDPEFSRLGLKYWQRFRDPNFKKTHWTTVGLRSYPFNQYVESKAGDVYNITFFLSTDWNVETYQGIRLSEKFLGRAESTDGKNITASPNAEKYITANVTPNEFLLTPAFPQFTEEWVKKINIIGKVADDTPPGIYILSIDILRPNPEKSDKWFLEYLNLYSEGVDMIKLDKPYLQAFINVR